MSRFRARMVLLRLSTLHRLLSCLADRHATPVSPPHSLPGQLRATRGVDKGSTRSRHIDASRAGVGADGLSGSTGVGSGGRSAEVDGSAAGVVCGHGVQASLETVRGGVVGWSFGFGRRRAPTRGCGTALCPGLERLPAFVAQSLQQSRLPRQPRWPWTPDGQRPLWLRRRLWLWLRLRLQGALRRVSLWLLQAPEALQRARLELDEALFLRRGAEVHSAQDGCGQQVNVQERVENAGVVLRRQVATLQEVQHDIVDDIFPTSSLRQRGEDLAANAHLLQTHIALGHVAPQLLQPLHVLHHARLRGSLHTSPRPQHTSQ
eukprot:scaffold4027_cov245-Pinguiococcus_pyrenoidosus.AAC.2